MPSHIVLADHGIPFDGESAESAALGGAETAFVELANALALRGHRVEAFTRGGRALTYRGVAWGNVEAATPEACDLYIANRGTRVLDLVPGARRVAFWIHNPAGYLLKLRYLRRLWRRRPIIVTLGAYHQSTLPRWVPAGGRAIIPYGLSSVFRCVPPRAAPPPPRAVFVSNPLRGLDRLLELWDDRIAPRVPGAEFHLFAGSATYRGGLATKAEAVAAVLEKAGAMRAAGVLLREPVAKAALAQELGAARLLLYGGDPGETFCLAVAEAQAAGVPAVVFDVGSLAERVIDGATGFVLAPEDRHGFAGRAVELLCDDALWTDQHRRLVAGPRGLGWDEAAALWERLLP